MTFDLEILIAVVGTCIGLVVLCIAGFAIWALAVGTIDHMMR